MRLQLKYGITNAAATAIIAYVSLLLGLITHPFYSVFPKNLQGVVCTASLGSFAAKHTYIVCPKNSCNALYSVEDVSRGVNTMVCSLVKFVVVVFATRNIWHLAVPSGLHIKHIPSYHLHQWLKTLSSNS